MFHEAVFEIVTLFLMGCPVYFDIFGIPLENNFKSFRAFHDDLRSFNITLNTEQKIGILRI